MWNGAVACTATSPAQMLSRSAKWELTLQSTLCSGDNIWPDAMAADREAAGIAPLTQSLAQP